MEEEDEIINKQPGTQSSNYSTYLKKKNRTIPDKKEIKTSNFTDFISKKGNSVYRGENTGFGESKYDNNLNWDAEVNENDIQGSINEHRANEQSGLAQLGLGTLRATTKALTEVAKLPGVVGGIIAAPFAKEGEGLDTAFNNGWIKSIDQFNENINTDLLPVYTAKAVKEGNLWDNIKSTSFWATDGADGIGFIAAMMTPGAIFEYANLGGKLIQGLSKSSKLAGMVEKTEAGVNALKFMGITGKNIDSGLAVMGNTIFEAGSEAKGVGDDLDRKKDQFVNDYVNQGYSIEEAESTFKEQRALAMRDTFIANVGILLGPNAIMHKAIWGKAGKTLVKESEEGLLKRAGKSLGRVVGAFGSEGLWEEGSQTTVQNMYTNKAVDNKLGKNDDFNIGDFTKEYVNTISSTDGQKAIFLGGILGGPMMSYQGIKRDVENRKQTNAVLQGVQNQITHFNDTFDTEIYKKNENGEFVYKKNNDGTNSTQRELDNKAVTKVAQNLNFTEQQSQLFDEAVQRGDSKIVEQLKQQAIFNMILPAIHNGEMGIQALEQKLNEDSKFNEIVEKDKTADEKDKAKSFVKETLETAKYLQKQNEKFQDFSKDVIELKNDNATSTQKEDFLNRLNSSYLNTKHQIKQDEKLLKTLQTKRENILEESNLEKGLQTEDELVVKEEKNNPLLKITNDEIRNIEKTLTKHNQDIANIWKGNLINESFNDFVNKDNEESVRTSNENIQKHEDVVNEIKSFDNKEELVKYTNKLPQDFKDNTHIQELVADHYKELVEQEKIQEAIKRIEEFEKDKEKFETDFTFGTEISSETKETIVEPISNIGLNTVQSSDLAEVDNNDNIFDENLNKVVDVDERTNPLNASKNQGASRIISTNKETGEPLFDKLKDFVEYEKKPRDKTKDKVTFDLGDINLKDLSFTANAIFERLKNSKNITEEETKYLENYLPIKVILSNNNKSAFSFIDSMNSKSKEIVELETLPLRKAIVNALIENKGDFNGIQGKVDKQFTGELKLGEQGSNILGLDVFKDMSNEDKIKYFKKNTVYVSNKGEVKYTSNDVVDETKLLSAKNKGEVFLKIPMINGKMFYLKLNVSRLTDEKANSVLDLITLCSNILNKQLEFSSEELELYIDNNLPNLRTEFEFIKRNNDSINVTLERLINFVVYSQNTNAKTKLILGKDGTLALGELLHKVNKDIPEWSGQLESYTYTNEVLNNLNDNQKQAIVEYLKYKRHNVLITKDDSATFNNDDYIKYLLGINSDYSVLTTNAVVNEPTFQGYSNIYLNQSVSNKNAKKTEVAENTKEINFDSSKDLLASLNFGDDVVQTIQTEVKPQSDIETKKANIEKRREEELNEFESYKPDINNLLAKDRPNFKDYYNNFKEGVTEKYKANQVRKQINAKYDAELKSLESENNLEPIKIVKSEKIQDIFKTADAKTQAKIVMVIAKQLGMTDKVNPKDMTSSFNKLFKELKDNETLQKEIKKICGL